MKDADHAGDDDWRSIVHRRLPIYGHRNWIVVADAAYPAHSAVGIETTCTNAGLIEVLKHVLAEVAVSQHVKPAVFIDRELDFVGEQDAPGISAFRAQLATILRSHETTQLPHEEIIAKLDEAARKFSVLIVKTRESIPYTSAFLQLQCGYWTQEAEARLRERLAS